MLAHMQPYEPVFDYQTSLEIEKADWIFRGLVFLTPDQNSRDVETDLLAAFSSLAIEHYRSIVLLCRSHCIGSAMALVRPLLDTISRGQWIRLCADTAQREAFMKNELDFVKERLGFKTLAMAVDAKSPTGPWLCNFNAYYSQLCDWTHTGHDAVAMRINEQAVEPTYSAERIRHLSQTVARVTVLHFCAVAELSGHSDRVTALISLLSALND